MKKSMVHVTFDTVDKFYPRVPSQRIEGKYCEDAVTKRICVAPTIQQALQSTPQAAIVLDYMSKIGIPLLIHVYYLTGEFYTPSAEQVPDISGTGEKWLLTEPDTVLRRDYIIEKYTVYHFTDINGNYMGIPYGIQVKPSRFQDNYSNLFMKLHCDNCGEFLELGYTFRTVIANLGDKLVEMAKQKT